MTTINEYSFGKMNDIRTITLPKSIKTIQPNSFNGCEKLRIVMIKEEATITCSAASAFEGTASNLEIYVKNTTAITTLCEKNVNKYIEEAKIGDFIHYVVTTDKKMVMYGMEAMNAVTKGNQPWIDQKENIETVIIDEDITTLEAYSFTEMTNLKQVTLPTSLISIGTYAFSQSGITTIS